MLQVILTSHPRGVPAINNFAIESATTPSLQEREVLLPALRISLDPLIRFAIDEAPNRVRIGAVLYGGAISQVVESRNPDFRVGDYVEGRTGWREFSAVEPSVIKLRKIDLPRIKTGGLNEN